MSPEKLPPPVWVATSVALKKSVDDLARQPRLAVDTESNSLHAYREQVCLIQFSTLSTDYLVDPLALGDLSALAPLFADPAIEKIFHAAEYDIITLKRDFGFSFTNIFDTMQSARILGYQAVGLDSILAEKFGLRVNKRYQKADWGQRPLPPDLLNYARLDTHYLLDLRDILKNELEDKGRWRLASEEFARLCRVNGGTENNCPPWQRVRGVQKLSSQQLAVLQELCRWRESQARRMNRPVFKVIGDKTLVSIAQSTPQTVTDLENTGLTSRQVHLFGNDLLRTVEHGLTGKPFHRPHSPRPEEAFLNRLESLRRWRQRVAAELGVESDIVLPKPYMQAIAEQNPQNMAELEAAVPYSPWRLEQYGAEILGALKRKK